MKTEPIKNYKYIFGPVPSRRLGTSLGIDLMPHKTCSLNCIYCECGKTTNLTTDIKEYVPIAEVKKEIKAYLAINKNIDYITFSGSGEPTLHSKIGEIINFLKDNYPQYKIALLTNGTLFYKKNVIDQVINADVIIPSLDAVSEKNFKKINRPCPSLDINKIIEGLTLLRKKFKGKLLLEVFIIPEINDNKEELEKIKDAAFLIAPDKIQVNTLDRPGTELDVEPIDKASVEKITKFFANAEFISNNKRGGKNCFNEDIENNEDKILSAIKRRPCTIEDIIKFTGIKKEEAEKIINNFQKNHKIKITKLKRGVFFH
ncbi:MAG: radical SAM protein [Deltaproteobacteria bacterium]|nr:radical SAM protein [Deltaproteobacteria bacterium]